MFTKYTHLEKLGTSSTHGILNGEIYFSPKLDGTNASVWLEDGQVCAGSRNRKLSEEFDNHGFYKFATEDQNIKRALSMFPEGTIIYGEWLVPHTIKGYQETAWRKFYVFDVKKDGEYLHYLDWVNDVASSGCDFIPHMRLENESAENLVALAKESDFLMKPGFTGEGMVVKNYNFVNKFGNYAIAKIINQSFNRDVKEESYLEPEEVKLARKYLDKHLTDKVIAKLPTDEFGKFNVKQFLSTVWYDFITEELHEVLKKEKNPTINFKKLNSGVIVVAKSFYPEIF